MNQMKSKKKAVGIIALGAIGLSSVIGGVSGVIRSDTKVVTGERIRNGIVNAQATVFFEGDTSKISDTMVLAQKSFNGDTITTLLPLNHTDSNVQKLDTLINVSINYN